MDGSGSLAGAAAGHRAPRALLAAVVLVSASGLMFELALTRIFSATIWYHYAFVAISVALFGWGLGGFFVYLLGLSRFGRHAQKLLAVLSIVLAVVLPLFPYGILQFPFSPERMNFYFMLSLAPFFVGGAVLSLAFESHGRDVNRLYFADLVGAAAGTLVVPVVLSLLGAETTVMAIAVLPALAAVILAATSRPKRAKVLTAVAVVVLAGNIGLAVWNLQTQTLNIRDGSDKALYKLLAAHPEARIESDEWNAYSRITSVSGFDDTHAVRLFIDSDAETSVLKWDGTAEGLADGMEWFRAFPFRIASEPRVLVIGPGGGTDVVLSLVAGSPKVTAVEMNPLIVNRVRQLGAAAGNLYDHPKVELVMDEGRNFIQRTDRKFDLIILGFVDSWASVASGGLSLTENYLYTREAIEAYYDHLSDRGALVIVRWPTDVPRLVANSVDFLTDRGLSVAEVGQRILAVAKTKPQGEEPVETVFMLARSPIEPQKIDAMLAGHGEAHVFYGPGRPSDQPYQDLFEGTIDFPRYTESFDKLATPVNDNHPFFFATDKPYGVPDFAVRLLTAPVTGVMGFAVVLLAGGRVFGFRAPGGRTLLYFAGLGVGFIVCEVALIQRLILLLGHPIYTLVVILFTLLLAGSLGSFHARRYPAERIGSALGRIIPILVVLIVIAAFALPAIVQATLALPLAARIGLTAALVFPFGFLMGMPFPLGLRHSAQDERGAPVSALWGVNGAASVIGSIAGMVLAVAAGFTWVFLAGAACYAVSWLARPR